MSGVYLRSHNITVCIKNAYNICVDKLVCKKGDSDYFKLSEMALWKRAFELGLN